jgi:CRP-like cAMP-binding protein
LPHPSRHSPVPSAPGLDDIISLPLFSGLPGEDVERLLSEARVEHVGDGKVICRSGDKAEKFFIILSGYVELSVDTSDGRRGVVEILEGGEVFGETAMFDGGHFPFSARTLAKTMLVAVPTASFLRVLEERFDLALLMLSSMSLRLRQLIHQITELKLKTTAQRLGGFLLSLTEVSSGQVEVHFPYDKKLAAEKLGMKPESLSRALMKLRKIGVSSVSDSSALIADIARLRAFCQEDGGEEG